jgi:hypothetical protein
MKLVSFRIFGRESYGVVTDHGIVDAAPLAPALGATLKEALERVRLMRLPFTLHMRRMCSPGLKSNCCR